MLADSRTVNSKLLRFLLDRQVYTLSVNYFQMLTKDRLNNPWHCNYSFHCGTQCLLVFVCKIVQVQGLIEFSKSPKTVLLET